MTQCPHHPRALGARAGDCRECDREVTPPTDAYREARAAIPRRSHTHDTTPTLRDLQTRTTDQEQQP